VRNKKLADGKYDGKKGKPATALAAATKHAL